MKRADKIKLLTNIIQGKMSLTDLLPAHYSIIVGYPHDVTRFYRNDVEINEDDFNLHLKQCKENKFIVEIPTE